MQQEIEQRDNRIRCRQAESQRSTAKQVNAGNQESSTHLSLLLDEEPPLLSDSCLPLLYAFALPFPASLPFLPFRLADSDSELDESDESASLSAFFLSLPFFLFLSLFVFFFCPASPLGLLPSDSDSLLPQLSSQNVFVSRDSIRALTRFRALSLPLPPVVSCRACAYVMSRAYVCTSL